MCGISGLFSFSKDIFVERYYAAHLLLSHRGPDDEGFVVLQGKRLQHYRGKDTISFFTNYPHIQSVEKARMILGQRRLSILDLSEKGHQPFEFENLTIVYNGEVFNYLELRTELIHLGYDFITDCDTEVILKAYHCWGTSCFNKFNGMWACAIYDKEKDTLILCRDRFGIKPLFYACDKDGIYFGSEMKFIKSFLSRQLKVNERAIHAYLTNSKTDYSEETFYEEIKELQPAHYLVLENNHLSVCRYWNCRPGRLKKRPEDVLEEFSTLFCDSLKLRMRSDVEVGTLLSGGLDSTTIVCSLKKMGLISGADFKTFSAVFKESQFSEKSYIDETVQQLGVVPHFVYPDPDELESYLKQLFFHIETPFRSLAVYSQFLLYKTINEKTNVKVLLNGQGADELFAGYNGDYYNAVTSYANRFNWIQAVQEFTYYRRYRSRVPLWRDIKSQGMNLMRNFFSSYLLNQKCYEAITFSPLREYLKYDDRTSMAFSVETRVPFLDYRLVEFALNLPEEYKINHFTNKKIVREYAKSIIPKSVLTRNDKMGFVSPQEIWHQKELRGFISRYNFEPQKCCNWIDEWRQACLNFWLMNMN